MGCVWSGLVLAGDREGGWLGLKVGEHVPVRVFSRTEDELEHGLSGWKGGGVGMIAIEIGGQQVEGDGEVHGR